MKKILYSNCSESIFRLDISELDDKKIVELQKEIMKRILEVQNQDSDDSKLDTTKELGEVEEEFSEKVYETSVFTNNIFGKKVLTVKGDFPYNNSKEVEAFARDNNLDYEFED